MTSATFTTFGNRRGPPSLRGTEDYPTHPRAVTDLLTAGAPIPIHVLDPCGAPDNPLAETLRAYGHIVETNHPNFDGVDFLQIQAVPPGVSGIIMNPPFTLAAAFTMHALTLVPVVFTLQRIQWLEFRSRAALFDSGKLVRCWILRRRCPRMQQDGWAGPRASGSLALAWFEFIADPDGSDPRIKWI